MYLCHWMRQSGLRTLLSLREAVYVGVSGGSMAYAPNIGGGLRPLEAAHRWRQSAGTS